MAYLFLSFSISAKAGTYDVNGFVTAAASYGDFRNNRYANGYINDEVRFDVPDSRMGLQVAADIADGVEAAIQILGKGGGAFHDVQTDWAYISYSLAGGIKIRAGEVKLPTFLTSDYIEVGYAYPWIRPPLEVYSLNPITSISGVEMLITLPLGGGIMLLQPYYGTSAATTTVPPTVVDNPTFQYLGAKGDPLRFDAIPLYGVNLSLAFDAITVRLGLLRAEVDQADFGVDTQTAEFASAGISMDWKNIVVYSEYAQRNEEEPRLSAAFPDQQSWYYTLGYRFNRLLSYVTYAEMDAGADPSAAPLEQKSISLGLRYELANSTALKLEAQQIEPETRHDTINYGLFDSPLNKDMATVYGIALDVIF